MTIEWQVIEGDCRVEIKALGPESADSVVCDPPYELGFMGKGWDRSGIAYDVEVWRECLRVLKPGGHLLAFGGSRTYHRLACAIEDAGFEIRDQIQWLYGSGFPKSLDVSKAIDRLGPPNQTPFAEFAAHYESRRRATGLSHAQVCAAGGWHGSVNHGGSSVNWANGYGLPTLEQWSILQPLLGLDSRWSERVKREQYERPVIGAGRGAGSEGNTFPLKREYELTASGSESAKRWEGWGTALKPAHEPIVLARKPLIGTVAENVLQHGTGGLNIDGCRIKTSQADQDYISERIGGFNQTRSIGGNGAYQGGETMNRSESYDATKGRWPANVIHDGSKEVLARFPEAEGTGHYPSQRGQGGLSTNGHSGQSGLTESTLQSGSTARFFYCAKATQEDRNEGLETLPHRVSDETHKRPRTELDDPRRHGVTPRQNYHPTVKPTDLMRYLCRLITPPGGIVLDPFCGSGSTGKAAMLEGLKFIGIELNAEYCELARRRIEAATKQGLLF